MGAHGSYHPRVTDPPDAAALEYAAGGRWRVWRHVNGRLMARKYQASPEQLKRDDTARGLWAQMREADPDLPDFPEGPPS